LRGYFSKIVFYVQEWTMQQDASDLARALARNAEGVCRHYLSNGRREGRYWLVGDARNTPGRSMYVHLTGPVSGKGAVGRWTDAATAERGDLLDVIREACGFTEFRDVAGEARRFLNIPNSSRHVEAVSVHDEYRRPEAADSSEAAQRLFAGSKPIPGTLVESYLRHRGITALPGTECLRFQPRCFYKASDADAAEPRPAMVAAVTNLSDMITGVHRTWLHPSGTGKAAVETPRRAMGQLLGNAVRFGTARDVLAAGEGIETMLSLRCALPGLPAVAALSAAHLAAFIIPAGLRRLYIARDADAAGDKAAAQLLARAEQAGIEVRVLSPQYGDFNDDLRQLGPDALRAALRAQLAPGDAIRFMRSGIRPGAGRRGS
jgi:hypothetical protein